MKFSDMRSQFDYQYGCKIAAELSEIGNEASEMGFRNAGSTGEKKAAQYIKHEIEKLGVQDISEYPFEVDTWEFKKAVLRFSDNEGGYVCCKLSAFAGTPGTTENGINSQIIDAGYGTYDNCKTCNLKGAIAFIRIDLDGEYWIEIPAYQLELMGVIAIIVMFEGESYGCCDDVLNSANSAARSTIPIMNISKKDGRILEKMLKQGEVMGELTADIMITKGSSSNIVWAIPGKQKDKGILLGAHYDGYFKAYIDDSFGIGALFSITKAMIQSGEIPNYTIVFIAHGAEEFGVCDSHYDWCIGSWNQINNLQPDWNKVIGLFLNIDAVNPDSDKLFVHASPQLHIFLKKTLYKIRDEIEKYWKEGFEVKDINGTWSDDFNYYMAGIPVLIAGRGETNWRKNYYHTDYDTNKQLNMHLMEAVCNVYGQIVCEYDKSKFAPVEIEEELRVFEQAVDVVLLEKEGIKTEQLHEEICRLRGIIKMYRKKEQRRRGCANDDFIAGINNKLIKVLRAVDFEDNVIFKLEERQKNIKILNRMREHLRKDDLANSFCEMKLLYGGDVINDFQREVYEYWCLDAIDSKKVFLQWGEGKIECPPDIRKLKTLFENVDRCESELEEVDNEIRRLKEEEIKKLRKCLDEIVETLKMIIGNYRQ